MARLSLNREVAAGSWNSEGRLLDKGNAGNDQMNMVERAAQLMFDRSVVRVMITELLLPTLEWMKVRATEKSHGGVCRR